MKLVKIVLAGLILFLLVSFGVTMYLGPDALRLCASPTKDQAGKCAPADAIVVISGGDTVARTNEAVALYKKGWAPALIFSGAAADKSGPSNAKAMQIQAVDAGVEGANTIVEEQSNTTDQNADYVMKIAKSMGYKSVILVTSAYHERRALLQFDHYANVSQTEKIDIRPHPVAEDKDWNRFWWLTPWGWNLAASEMIKSVVVSVGGFDRSA